jgi:pimeloyl-ACP methyl ester carboxylesterase
MAYNAEPGTRGNLSGRPRLRLADPPLQFIDVHGYRRAFRTAGNGPRLLLLHGFGDSSATWSGVLPLLSRRHTVIAPDLLGHGESDKPRAGYSIGAYACGMRDLLSVLDVERVTVLGHCLGGSIAMQFAYQFPERCERLVLVSSGGAGREVHPLLRMAAAPGADAALPLATTALLRTVIQLAEPVLRRAGRTGLGRDVSYLLGRYRSLTSATARAAFLRTLRAGVAMNGQVVTMLDRCYLAAGMPTFIIWGEHDRVIPVQHAATAHAALPGSRLMIFTGAGHFPHHDDPRGFAAAVDSFVAGTRPSHYDPARWRKLLREGPDPAPAADTDLHASSGC